MSLSFEVLVASRYLRSRRQEGFISVVTWFSFLGIMLGVAALIVVMSVMNGFRAELLHRILGLNGHAQVLVLGQGPDDRDALARALEAVPGVALAAPLVEGQALATAGGRNSGVVVRGVRAQDLLRKPIVADNVRKGDLAALDDDRAAIGRRLADRFGLRVGDRLTLISPTGKSGPFGTMPRQKAFEVAAIFETGGFEFDNGFVFVSRTMAAALFGAEQEVIEVTLERAEDAAALARIGELAGPAGRVSSWTETNGSLATALKVERNVMFLILSLIITVAAFNIVSSLVMLVKEKAKGVAVLRTMGATRGAVLRIFLLCGMGIGVLGTLTGFGLGVGFALNIEAIRQALQGWTGTELFAAEIYFLSHLPAEVEWREVAQVVGLSLLLSLLATVYPAWRASSVDPVEGLRDE